MSLSWAKPFSHGLARNDKQSRVGALRDALCASVAHPTSPRRPVKSRRYSISVSAARISGRIPGRRGGGTSIATLCFPPKIFSKQEVDTTSQCKPFLACWIKKGLVYSATTKKLGKQKKHQKVGSRSDLSSRP